MAEPTPLSATEEDVLGLIAAAAASIKNGEPDGAAWRLADALLLVGPMCDLGDVIGLELYTGRGARLDDKADSEPNQRALVQRWREARANGG